MEPDAAACVGEGLLPAGALAVIQHQREMRGCAGAETEVVSAVLYEPAPQKGTRPSKTYK